MRITLFTLRDAILQAVYQTVPLCSLETELPTSDSRRWKRLPERGRCREHYLRRNRRREPGSRRSKTWRPDCSGTGGTRRGKIYLRLDGADVQYRTIS